MNLDLVADVIKITAVAIPFVITATTYIAANSKNKRLKKAAENVNKIAKAAQTYVTDAEQFINFSGTEKKTWVLTKINQYAIQSGIPFDEDQASEIVEEIVTITKKVNQRDKDKKKEVLS
jgi:ABC-type transporter Mla subunit MlaD